MSLTLSAFIEPFFFLTNPSKRLFWMHLVGSFLLVLLFIKFRGREINFRTLRRLFLRKEYWWNRSTKIDYALLFLNSTLKLVVYVPLIGGQLAIGIAVARFMHLNLAEAPQVLVSPLAVTMSFTLVAFVFDDFTRFAVHRLMHLSPLLWRFHRIHHSATTLTPITVFRTHPVESLINYCRASFSLGVISGLFIWSFGQNLQVWDILGVNALGFLFSLLGSNLRHSHIPLSFGLLERWLVSPAQHQLHHSVNHGHCNLGSFLSIWDRMSGTHIYGEQAVSLRFGLSGTGTEYLSEGRAAFPKDTLHSHSLS